MFLGVLILLPFGAVFAAEATIPDIYYRGEVVAVEEQEEQDMGAYQATIEEVTVRITSGAEKDKEIIIERGVSAELGESQRVKPGDSVIVVKQEAGGEAEYYIADFYRLPALGVLAAIFLGFVLFFGRTRGITSVLGLICTLIILGGYAIPRIIEGGDPLRVSLIAAIGITVISLYLAHGFNKRTSLALVSTLLTLGISVGVALLSVWGSKLFGLGSEDAYSLQLGPLSGIDLQGLLLGGIIIGALGVLDDITTGQTAAVYEIKQANPSLGFQELYKRGLSVGREHIASLVNTLALAYVGVSLPLFLVFAINQNLPLWVLLNTEFIAEEVVRTLVGSITLVLGVPIATFFAAYFLRDKK